MGTIIAFTFKEARRKRLVLAIAVLSLAFLALFAVMAHLIAGARGPALGEGGLERAAVRLGVVLLGVYLARSFAGLLAILVAAGAISAEIESGALQSVVARPVRRFAVLLGKFAGYGLLLVLFTAALQGAVMLIGALVAGAGVPHPLAVLALLCLEPLVLLALTLFGSTFLPTLANGAAAVLLYGLAVVGGTVEQLGQFAASRALYDAGIVTSLLLPADVMYRKAFAVASAGLGGAVAQVLGPVFGGLSEPSTLMVVYAALYVLALLAAAARVLGRRDL